MAPWLAEPAPFHPGVPADEVTAKLASVGRQTSSDVLQLFAIVNGMTAGESDTRMFSLWGIDQCVNECGRYGVELIPFADFLISSCEYCLKRESSERSSVVVCYPDAPARQVAESVEQFFHLLVTDPVRVEIAL